jgi:hypothetical protein
MDRETQNRFAEGAQERREANVRERHMRPEVAAMMRMRREEALRVARDRLGQAQAHMIAAE